jgi:AcrR family transcriptional regulator
MTASSSRPAAGRPTKAQQAARHAELMRVALDQFLEHGFDQASVEGIAAEVGMSKRTIYARYKDKAELFRAAVDQAVDGYTISAEDLATAQTGDLRETLLKVARLRLANLSRPDTIRLQRVLTAQSYHFPDLFREAFGRSIAPTIDFLEAEFERHTGEGAVTLADPRYAASAFLSLVVGGPARIIVAGQPLKADEIERHLEFTVDLFLYGILAR